MEEGLKIAFFSAEKELVEKLRIFLLSLEAVYTDLGVEKHGFEEEGERTYPPTIQLQQQDLGEKIINFFFLCHRILVLFRLI